MKKRLVVILSVSVTLIAAVAAVFLFLNKPKQPLSQPPVAPHRPAVQPPRNAPAAPGAVNPQAAVPAPKTLVTDSYEYNARGRRDPFATLIVKTETERKKGAVPIESYALNEFKLTAVLWNNSGIYALVSSPDGKNFTLKPGTVMGLHGGKVYKITKNSVTIREFLKDYRGKVLPKDTVLKLHREEEG